MGGSSSTLKKRRHPLKSNLVNLKGVPNSVTYQKSSYVPPHLPGKNRQINPEVEVLPSIQEVDSDDDTNNNNTEHNPHKKQPKHPSRPHFHRSRSDHSHTRPRHHKHITPGYHTHGEFDRSGYGKVTKKIHVDFCVKNNEKLLTSLVHYYKKNERVSYRKIKKRGCEWSTNYVVKMEPHIDMFQSTEKEIYIIPENRQVVVELDKKKELDLSSKEPYFVNFDISVTRNWKKTTITSLYNFDIQITGTHISVILNSDSPIINGHYVMDNYVKY